ncbi:MAG: thioredoxin family protein [Candidatus Obscuribacterales bacterium]|nr:thioredoxin family protein [Candidatus Obscuribacterales bacterium]
MRRKALFAGLCCTVLLTACSKTLKDKLAGADTKYAAGAYVDVNSSDPGKEIDVKKSIAYGKYTIIDFTSEYCSACEAIHPYLEELCKMRSDIVVRSFDVNRPGVEGIDWESPLVAQYHLHQLPTFRIYDASGHLMAEGDGAKNQIMEAINNDVVHADRK